jgi:hypothetical protein
MIRNTLTLAGGALAALLGTQAPEFAQQYTQRLGGAVDELRRVVENFDRDARLEGLDRTGALARMAASPDPLFVRQGVTAAGTIGRFERLAAHRVQLETASAAGRVAGLAQGLDWDLARATADDYRLAVPATVEGAGFGLAGFLAGFCLVRLLAWPFRRRPGQAGRDPAAPGSRPA